jgi:hypothetical protein
MDGTFLTLEEKGLLAAVPDHLSISDMLKATPVTEGSKRFVYIEASNEEVDQQGEIVKARALQDSAAYYLQFGNLDIDHFTQIGAKMGIPGYELYEIGRPVEVKVQAGTTFVKGEIYTGVGVAAERANSFWSSLVDVNPPARWYPSVGGKVTGKSITIDPASKEKRAIINSVRWTNIGFSKTPVNANLSTVSAVPFGALTKSLCAEGFDFVKAIEAGYGTDAAALAGGAALRKQSLDPTLHSYWDFRDSLAGMISAREVRGGDPAQLVKAAVERLGVPRARAAQYVERFLRDLQQNRRKA